jgi:hypothetical protein
VKCVAESSETYDGGLKMPVIGTSPCPDSLRSPYCTRLAYEGTALWQIYLE